MSKNANTLALPYKNKYYIVNNTKFTFKNYRENTMNPFLFNDDEEKKYALACLKFSKKLGLIDDDSLEAVIKRCDAENEKRKLQKENNETVYGLTHFSYPAYLDYELTRLKLDFVGECENVKKAYTYKEISRKQMKAYFKQNKDLFTRYNNDKFFFFEVKRTAFCNSTKVVFKFFSCHTDTVIGNFNCSVFFVQINVNFKIFSCKFYAVICKGFEIQLVYRITGI